MHNFRKGQMSFILCLFVIFLNLVVIAPLTAATWSPPIDLSLPGGNATQAQVVSDLDGHKIAVWTRFNGSNFVIQSSTRNLSGVWSTPVTLSENGGDAFFPQIATDSLGNAIAVWSWKSDANIVIQAAGKSLNMAWTAPVNISRHAQFGHNTALPQLTIDNQGNAYVVWQEYSGTRNDIHFASKQFHRSWTSAIKLSNSVTPGLGDVQPKIVVNSLGNLIVVWTNSELNVIQSRERKVNHNWTIAKNISESGNQVSSPQIAVDQNGNAYAVWSRNDGSNMVIQASNKSYSGDWTTPVNLSMTGQDAILPSLSVNSNGYAIAAWQRFDGAYSIIQTSSLRRSHPKTWLPSVDVTETGEDATNPQVVVGIANTGVLVWKRSDGSNFVIEASTAVHGKAWTNPLTLSVSDQDAVSPVISLNPLGTATTLWVKSDGTNSIIQSSNKQIL